MEELCAYGRMQQFEESDVLMEIGQGITHIPIILSGSVRILTEDKEGQELLLYYLETGDTCAVTLNCCTRKAKSRIRAQAESTAELLFIPVDKMEEWLIRYHSWRNFVLDSYSGRLDEMLLAIDNLVFNNMEERLIKYLKDKVWVNKSPTLQITHYQIANDLHSSRVVISRLMKKLEKDQKIIQHRNKVEVLDF
ncbi:MAG: Crp/Fnr family transcriptional regulator [Bacteroidota bacterium]